MSKNKGVQFNCFSPPVMIATMTAEVLMAGYVVWRYKMTQTLRLATLTLLNLATFQLAEYFVCTGYIGHTMAWSRLGFAAITTLPPMGLHLMHRVAGKLQRRLVKTAYASMSAFILFFLTMPNVFDNYQCTGNYVIFHLQPHYGGIYWVYYMGWLFISIYLGARWANELMKQKKLKKLNAVRGLIVGWLIFLVPTAIANIVNPISREAIPSIMCGFAVLFALILTFYILPRIATVKSLIGHEPIH